jgi:hypothetical protein
MGGSNGGPAGCGRDLAHFDGGASFGTLSATPGARLLRDTMVRTGERAERIARVGFVAAVLLAIAAPALVVLAHRLVRALATP